MTSALWVAFCLYTEWAHLVFLYTLANHNLQLLEEEKFIILERIPGACDCTLARRQSTIVPDSLCDDSPSVNNLQFQISPLQVSFPEACYTIFVIVSEQWQNYFFVKKLSFVKHDVTKRGLYKYVCSNWKYTKKVLWIRQKTAYLGECIFRKSFSWNAHESDKLLSTHYSHFTWISSIHFFLSLFVNSV